MGEHWAEHGWALKAWHVVAILLGVLAASLAARAMG